MASDRRKHIERAARAHSDLNLFSAIATILEGGHIYGGSRTERAAERIISICRTEQRHLYEDYSAACAKAARPGSTTTGGEA